MSGQRAQAPDSVSPARMGEYAAARANALYEAVQWAENGVSPRGSPGRHER